MESVPGDSPGEGLVHWDGRRGRPWQSSQQRPCTCGGAEAVPGDDPGVGLGKDQPDAGVW